MTDMEATTVELPQDKPPRWANSLMKWALTAPLLQRMVGEGVALLSFTGHKTGKSYTIPVSYYREGEMVTVITKRQRNWWRNFETPAEVELRLAGSDYTGKAEIRTDQAANLEFMTEYLAKRPIDAKAYGLSKDEVVKEKIARIVPHIVVIQIEIAPVE